MAHLEPQRGCSVVDLELIRPEDLHTVWDVVREGMLKSSEYSNDQWIPEDAYCAIKANQASLYLWVFEGNVIGHIILQKKPTYYGSCLHIWSLYVEHEHGDLIDSNMVQIDEIAIRLKCNRMSFWYPRKGWDRRAEKLGFSPVMTIYEKGM